MEYLGSRLPALAMKQLAVVNHAHGRVRLSAVRCPVPQQDEVLLRVAAVAVCGSEVHQWRGTHSWPVNYPVILGHEFAGTVEEVAAGVQGFAAGDRVTCETAAVIDPQSPMTRRGWYHLDPSRKGFGYGVDGAMTSYISVPARCLHLLPSGVTFTEAALAEPCCVAYNAVVHNGDAKPGDRVVVLGPGPIGLLCALMARLQGAEVIVVGLERDSARLAVAEDCGLETMTGDPSGSMHADGVIDAAGVSASLRIALHIVRPAGWITKVGWGREPFGHSLDPLVQKNVTLRGSFSHYFPVWQAVLRLMAERKLDVDPLVQGVLPLGRWEEAFEAMHTGQVVKTVLVPEASEEPCN